MQTPTISLSLTKVKQTIAHFSECLGIPKAHIYYPVKVNNHPKLIAKMNEWGLNFETGAVSECEQLIKLGIKPQQIRYGNPIKSAESITRAHQLGITCFGADTFEELEKIALLASKSSVYIRVAVNNAGAEWALTEKFGCPVNQVHELFEHGQKLGLNMFGISFHVGWNNEQLDTWKNVFEEMLSLVNELKSMNFPIISINIGGGFPAHSGNQFEKLEKIAVVIKPYLEIFEKELSMEVIAEPGSYLVANAGSMFVKVIARVKRNNLDWVYVDSGIFQGFSWIMGGLDYHLEALENKNTELQSMVVCGPTCDTHDVFSHSVMLPKNIGIGDIITISPAGAYISSSKSYNGFDFPEEEMVE